MQEEKKRDHMPLVAHHSTTMTWRESRGSRGLQETEETGKIASVPLAEIALWIEPHRKMGCQ